MYGKPRDVEAIQTIADNYNLKVIYDAAHAFGVQDQGGSILRHGDLSVLSFHATKVFNTCEGGAIICPDDKSKKLHIDHLKNFGFVGETTVVASGINGKMNEMQSALGLLQLKHIDQALARRHAIDGQYREALQQIPGIRPLARGSQVFDNHAYFPILVDPLLCFPEKAATVPNQAHGDNCADAGAGVFPDHCLALAPDGMKGRESGVSLTYLRRS